MMQIGLRNLTLAGLFLASGAVHAYSTSNGTIYDANDQPVQLRGVNWFGFEGQDHVGHGLWTRNWKDMIAQMKGVGFNAVRIPICPGTLHGSAITSVDFGLNPDLAGKDSLQILDLVLAEFDRQGFYILLDHHRPDCYGGISELWYTNAYSEQAWLDDLVFMAQRYRMLPHLIGIDIKNEPHGAATWGTGNPATDWNTAAETAAAAIHAVAPELLIFVEGIQENPTCSGPVNHWWGGNLEPLACHPLAIPADRLVLSPHVYGPDVYAQPYFSAPDFPANLPAIWDAHFGRFRAAGHTIAIGETGGRYGHGGDAKDKPFQDALVDYLIAKDISHLFYWSWNPNSGDTGGILQDDWRNVWQDKLALLGRLWNGGGSAACTDGLDNDGDGLADYPADPGCVSPTDSDEYNPPLPPAKLELPVSLNITSDWGAGYCANATVTNGTGNPVEWTTRFQIQGAIRNLWNATYRQTGDTVEAAGVEWNQRLNPGVSASFGFCAERPVTVPKNACEDGRDNDGDGLIDYPNDPGCASATDNDESNPGPGAVTAALHTTNDWGAGYCANVDVTNNGAEAVAWQVDLNIQGQIYTLWNAVYTQTGSALQARGVEWNRLVPARGTAQFGFCANR